MRSLNRDYAQCFPPHRVSSYSETLRILVQERPDRFGNGFRHLNSRRHVLLLLTGLFCFMLSGCLAFQPLPNSVDRQLQDAAKEQLDGLIVYVDRQGHPPELYSAGWMNRITKDPANPRSLFKIASISKLYTAAAVAKLVYAGKLSLERTLADYLPSTSDHFVYADQISLRMLLQHRSGIPDFINDPKFPWSKLPLDLEDYLVLAMDKSPLFRPGTSYGYSNTNYLLIGMILDRTLGYSHSKYIKDEILDPLGLTHTFGSLNDVALSDVISGYYIGYDGDLKSQNYISPGGSMVANAGDVGIFLRALIDGTLFKPEEQKIYSSIYVYDHTGLLPGYSSLAKYNNELDTVVVLFVSTSGGNSWWVSEILLDRIWKIIGAQALKDRSDQSGTEKFSDKTGT